MSIRLSLTDAEVDALDRLFDAWLATEERWEIVPHIRAVRAKLNARNDAAPASVQGAADGEVSRG